MVISPAMAEVSARGNRFLSRIGGRLPFQTDVPKRGGGRDFRSLRRLFSRPHASEEPISRLAAYRLKLTKLAKKSLLLPGDYSLIHTDRRGYAPGLPGGCVVMNPVV